VIRRGRKLPLSCDPVIKPASHPARGHIFICLRTQPRTCTQAAAAFDGPDFSVGVNGVVYTSSVIAN
jgi:hypothetical protein